MYEEQTMAVVAAKKLSQVIAHLAIAFVVTWAVTGSMLAGGLAVLVEPVINVLLLPIHERIWARIRAGLAAARRRYLLLTCEKVSQTVLHMGVAFAVMFWMTGSLAIGGLAAVIEPVCNVLILPVLERAWEGWSTPRQSCAL
jgi:uncharacterized membrane protein